MKNPLLFKVKRNERNGSKILKQETLNKICTRMRNYKVYYEIVYVIDQEISYHEVPMYKVKFIDTHVGH